MKKLFESKLLKPFKHQLFSLINYWPPYFGAGIKANSVSRDFRKIEVQMKMRFWNQNYLGTQFGGSLYSMTDPFYVLMLLENLGPGYIVWDKRGSIRYKKPTRKTVYASFELTEDQINEIKQRLKQEPKVEPEYTILIKDAQGEVVAEVQKTLHIKLKSPPAQLAE